MPRAMHKRSPNQKNIDDDQRQMLKIFINCYNSFDSVCEQIQNYENKMLHFINYIHSTVSKCGEHQTEMQFFIEEDLNVKTFK